jgi:hypothetical protein
VNVLSAAPYGYLYMKKNEATDACYVVDAAQAAVVREVFQWYTVEGLSIGAIARRLNEREVPTRFGKSRWERSRVWAMLRNPAYAGRAAFGKTERAERKRVTRPLRQKGGYSARCSANRERPKDQWIEMAVPALVSEETFARAAEKLSENRRFSSRNTKEPTLLQGLLVCGQCGYSLYRTSTRTTKRQAKYYRCLGSDGYRHLKNPPCACRPIRVEDLDELVWKQVTELLEKPELLRAELERRRQESLKSDPLERRRSQLTLELMRVEQQIDKLLDAYQEDLVPLGQLRQRMLAFLQEWTRATELSLHPSKTRIVNAVNEGFDFLGWHFRGGKKWPRKKSLQKLREKLRPLTRRANEASLSGIIAKANPILRGWHGYFRESQRSGLSGPDGWLRRRLRAMLRKREKRPGYGLSEADSRRWPNRWFAARGLFSLELGFLRLWLVSTRPH